MRDIHAVLAATPSGQRVLADALEARRAAQRDYAASPKGREARRAARARYEASAQGRLKRTLRQCAAIKAATP